MTCIETSWDAAFDYAMSIISRPSPAQEWLTSLLDVPLPDAPEEPCAICGLADCEGCLVEDSMTAYKRYRDAHGEECV